MRVHDIDGVNVFFFDFDSRRISGWSFHVNVGDEVRSQMQSGKIARFKVEKIDRMLDPKDQYFGTVSDIGYL